MGYDIKRFICEVEDFACFICLMVVENPKKLPCGHVFCHECIRGWLSVFGYCPLDCGSVQLRDIRSVDENLLEILDELMLKCDFNQQGCPIVVKLEHLQAHLSECTFNVYRNIIWENDKLCCGRDLPHLSKWQINHNMKISIGEPSILETDTEHDRKYPESAFIQSFHCLEPGHSYFRIQILNTKYLYDWISVGLNCKFSHDEPGWRGEYIACSSSGRLTIARQTSFIGPKWKIGDIIKCGIKFSTDYQSNGGVIKVYFLVNQRMTMEKMIKMPRGGFFPTIAMSATGIKVRYLNK